MNTDRDLIIHLVGVPHVAKPTEGVFPAKGYILVAMLLLAGSGRMNRQSIAALLWDDVTEEKALTNLRQLLVRIHRCWPYEDALIETEGSLLVAGPGARHSDLASILTLYKSAVLAERVQAVLLAKGELLDTLDTGGGELAQWFRGERERFRRLVLSLGADVLLEMTRFGRAPEREIDAIGERMLALEPEREESFRALIEAYGRNGNYSAVNRTFAALKETLSREFNSEPRPETLAVMRRITASVPRPKIQSVVEYGGGAPDEAVREIASVANLAGLPRVALFPPAPAPGQVLHPLHRALIEDVADNLSRHRTFAVIAPYSSFAVAETPDAERLAALKSGYFISGFMTPGIEQLALRLTRRPGDEIIWAAEYPVGLEDLPASFRLISRQIASTLIQEIERDQLDRMRADPKPLAYRHYLEGRDRLKNCDLPKLRRARAEFRQSIEIDAGFAASHGAIAQTLQLEWLMLGGTDPSLLNQARNEAETAIAIDVGNGVGHWMAATIALYQRDFDYVGEKFQEAETLNPHSADLLANHADALSHLGDAESGWQRFQRALELNPFPPDHYWWIGSSIALRRRDYVGAIELCNKMESEQKPLKVLAASYGLLGDYKMSRQYGRLLREIYPGMSVMDMTKMAPDRRKEDMDLVSEGLRLAGLD